MIGKVILHYRILEKLGGGGMGVVYKAEDTKLKRLVALKFLPPDLTRDEDAKERFVHEAQAASALDHPNICNIHEIDETEDGQIFICMAYYEGETLKKKIERGPLPIDQALDLTLQTAQGLARAHEAGITHRDIKPANLMITNRGEVKIVDFGLAKLAGQERLTKAGMTVGTVAYMSPEQARGEEVDHRTDIWSLGVVLYEMLTGHLPFRGDYEAAIMYSIINEEPQPAQKYRPELSSEFLHVLNRVLEKTPEDRYQSVSEMLIDLRRLKKETARVSRQPLGEMRISETPTMVQAPRLTKKKMWIGLGVAAILGIIVSVLLLLPERPAQINPNMTFRVLQIPFSQVSFPGLSPDGNWVAFSAADAKGKWEVYYMHASGGEPRRITSDSSALIFQSCDISSNGSQITYHRFNPNTQKAEVCIVSSLGGMSKKIAEVGGVPRWRPDGQRIGYIILGSDEAFGPTKSGKLEFWTVKPDGNDNRLEFVDSISISGNLSFSWSPDGKSVAWIRTFPEGFAEVIVRELETGKERQLTFDKRNIDEVCWTRNDEIIFSSNKSGNVNLWMVPASGGPTVQITRGSGPDIGNRISADGKKLVYLQRQQIGHIWIAKSDGSSARQITFDESDIWGASLSPDGRHLIFRMGYDDSLKVIYHIYLMNRDGSNRRQLPSGNESVFGLWWSPDGKWIAYSSRSPSEPVDSAEVYHLKASNPGAPKLIGKGWAVWWLNPNNFIVFTQTKSLLASVDGTELKQFYEDSTWAYPILGENHVLFWDLHKGREGWWIAPTIGPNDPVASRPRKILAAGYTVAIAPNGKFLLYVKNVGEVWKISLPDGKEERLPGPFPELPFTFSVSYDGNEIVYVVRRINAKLVMIENLFK